MRSACADPRPSKGRDRLRERSDIKDVITEVIVLSDGEFRRNNPGHWMPFQPVKGFARMYPGAFCQIFLPPQQANYCPASLRSQSLIYHYMSLKWRETIKAARSDSG